MANKIKWNEADFRWDDNPHLWNLVVEIVESIDKHGGTVYDAVKDLDKDKKKELELKQKEQIKKLNYKARI